MKKFLGFIIKEFISIFRDKRTMVVLFGMPIAQLIIFGFAIRNELNDATIAFFDQSNDYMTEQIKQKLVSSNYFKLGANLQSNGMIEEAFKGGKIKEVIIFEPNFAQKLLKDGGAKIQIITDASDPNMAQTLLSYTSAIIKDYQTSLNKQSDLAPIIQSEVKMIYNPEIRSTYMFVPGLIALILLLVCALMTSIAITKEKEIGTMEVLLVSPLKPIEIIIGKVIPYLLLSFFNVITILILARVVFNVPFVGSYILFFFIALIFIMTALSLGILISSVAQTQQAAMMMSLAGLLLPTIILSGFIFPISNMPLLLQWFSNIIPAKWFLIIAKGIMLKGVGFDHIWKETLILCGMFLFFILISIKKFKVRL
jgi:ABC-2 type transport system permease protein